MPITYLWEFSQISDEGTVTLWLVNLHLNLSLDTGIVGSWELGRVPTGRVRWS